MKTLRVIATALVVVLGVAYPFVVYFGLGKVSPRTFAFALLGLLGLRALSNVSRRSLRETALALRVLLPAIACAAIAAILNEPLFLLLQPVLVNAGLLMSFGMSLRGVPIVERFARMQVPDLSDAEVRHCRRTTEVWCGFFLVNAVVSLVLAAHASIEVWTLYTGGIAYGGMALLFTVEFVVRKVRFRRYGAGLHDRVFAALFPARPGGAG